MCDPGEKASLTMYREFMEEAMANDNMSQGEKDAIKRRLKVFFSTGEEVILVVIIFIGWKPSSSIFMMKIVRHLKG